MKSYNQNASVIYTDSRGRKIDTFVIFDTDPKTGLTHINYENLKVSSDKLMLHSKTVCKYHLPISDAFSFEMINKLREKYAERDRLPRKKSVVATPTVQGMVLLANAS